MFNISHDRLKIAHFLIAFFANISSGLGYLVYLEMVELNFCGLNKNTRRNIQEREQREKDLNNRLTINNDSERSSFSSNLSQIDVSPDYSIYYNKESFFDDNDDNKNSQKFLEFRTIN